MNTTPDEVTLALWVEDELGTAAASGVDAWAAAQPEWLERREQARQIKSLLSGNLPAAEEPPYAEFFNARIAREISRGTAAPAAAAVAPVVDLPGKHYRWFLPATAVAGMVFCFWAGTRLTPAQVVEKPSHILTPVMYTPEKGVNADWFASEPAGAMVIVLDGVAAIPDSFELPDTALRDERPPLSTADIDSPSR